MLEKVIKERPQLHHKPKACISQIMHGDYGRHQLFYASKAYCCISSIYCPLQSGETAMKECSYKELIKKMNQ